MGHPLWCLSFSVMLIVVGFGGVVASPLTHVTKLSPSFSTSSIDPEGPENITDKDDAFHESDRWSMEWWYFDVISDNNYSIELNFNIFSQGSFGLIFTALCVYQNMRLVQHVREFFLFNEFFVSTKRPLLQIQGQTVMNGSINNRGMGVYDVSFDTGDVSVDLHFIGTTPGWKLGDWSVVLPKARVKGILHTDDSMISIRGTGYHDHNWNVTQKMMTQNEGWLWGKNIGQNLSLIWAQMIKETSDDLLFVLNEDNNGFSGIDGDDVHFEVIEYMYDHGEQIPSKMQAKGFSKNAHINLSMEVVNHHYIDVFILKYWRFHVKTTGMLSRGSNTEEMKDDVEIMEYITFAPIF